MLNRFDLEEKIHIAWQTSQDIDQIFAHLCESRISSNDAQNALMGLKVLHDMRMQDLFDVFKQMWKLDEYNVRGEPPVEFP